ncbi:MAG TPA: TetR/AcrR family transcriptional regulator [Spirochaetia bacterium]|nr:TetR/AcrR family transcriptional regulator [Spirochaetia bacterium]
MARPRSEEKKAALLDAATNVVALHGLGASTASIARLAGVAEGTLFRYFSTKDSLFNKLYLHLKQGLREAMRRSFVVRLPMKDRVRSLWDGYIDWGIAHPSSVKALNRLADSESITPATKSKADKIFPEVAEVSKAIAAKGAPAERPAAFADAIFMALADTTIQFAIQDPRQAVAYRKAGFRVLWEGLTTR